MKKIYLFMLAALTLGLTACDNYFDATYLDNGDPYITVVRTIDMQLAYADYQAISKNSVNKALAAQMDSIKGLKNRYQNALKRVGEEGYFNNYASSDMYLPAFLNTAYPQLDPGSIVNVTYDTEEGLQEYLLRYNAATQITVDVETIDEIPSKLPQPDEGQVIGVLFNGQELLYESIDGYKWTPAVLPEGMYLLPEEANGQVVNWLKNTFPYAELDQVETVMWYEEAVKHYLAYEYTFDGEDWTPYVGLIEETLSFLLDAKKGWAANLSTYYWQAVAGDGNMGKLQLFSYDLQEGISYIWAFDNTYGMKGTAFLKSTGGAHVGEGWCVTPKIKLKNSVAPALSFDMAMNYGPLVADGRYEQATVWVSTDYKGDPKAATWTQLPWNIFDAETGTGFPDADSWTFYNTGRMDLSQWNNQAIYIGFRYKSVEGQTCSTWEVKNILVNEPEEEASEE